MGMGQSIMKVNFEDIKKIINKDNYFLINTLDTDDQQCIIKGTVPIDKEVKLINDNRNNKDIHIVIYGKNTNDEKIYKKYKQLISLGIANIYIYPGGVFEWLCLQDIYGKELFPTTSMEFDILKFKPISDRITIL